jgi:hypothetical protein
MRNVDEILGRKPEGKKPLKGSEFKWVYIIKVDLKEIG